MSTLAPLANSIIGKAQAMGLTCQLTTNNQWQIFLKEDYIFSQTETQWRLSVERNFSLDLSDAQVLEFLEDLN